MYVNPTVHNIELLVNGAPYTGSNYTGYDVNFMVSFDNTANCPLKSTPIITSGAVLIRLILVHVIRLLVYVM